MTSKRTAGDDAEIVLSGPGYGHLVSNISDLLERARRSATRSVNAILTATYWEIGHRIVEYEQKGELRAGYGEELLARLSQDLAARHGRGFSERNLRQMRAFYLGWEIRQTLSAKFEARVKCPATSVNNVSKKLQTVSAQSEPSPAAAYLNGKTGFPWRKKSVTRISWNS